MRNMICDDDRNDGERARSRLSRECHDWNTKEGAGMRKGLQKRRHALWCRAGRGEIIGMTIAMADRRLNCQAERLLQGQAGVRGFNRVFFFDPVEAARKYTYPGKIRPWARGATLCYVRFDVISPTSGRPRYALPFFRLYHRER